jgi:pectate lyase
VNAPDLVVPGATSPASAVAEEVETSSVASYWGNSDARSTERAGACGGAGAENSFTVPTWSFAA